jgi:PhzF family phenazine biosynthesis protein
MSARSVRFKQVDVFTSVPFKGNPLAVVFDADPLSTGEMQAIARWTNLSETSFLLRPTDPQADYRVRIFTPTMELPFAGHPTLGTAHALLDTGYRGRQTGRLVQQCGVGLIELAERGGNVWAFAAPPARVTPLPSASHAALAAALKTDGIDFSAVPCAVDNGVRWLVVRLVSADTCLTLDPDIHALAAVLLDTGMDGLAVYGPHAPGGPAAIEVRCLMLGDGPRFDEDPVTGSANAAIAGLLKRQDRSPGPGYLARQGTVIQRAGHIHVSYDDRAERIWVGGQSVTVVDGTFLLA